MKCPKCFKELDDQDSFCGFCGAKVKQTELIVYKKKKSKIGIKVFLFLLIISLVSGAVLGFCMARGIIDWENFAKQNEFGWTDFSEAKLETDSLQEEEDKGDEKKNETEEMQKEIMNSEEVIRKED